VRAIINETGTLYARSLEKKSVRADGSTGVLDNAESSERRKHVHLLLLEKTIGLCVYWKEMDKKWTSKHGQ
jgi:hypothetical protein